MFNTTSKNRKLTLKKYSIVLLITLLTMSFSNAYTQTDTVIVYDINLQSIDTILPVSFNTNLTFDKTSSSTGTLGNQTQLSLTPPNANLFSNSNFSDIEKAELFFNINDYPIRTAIRLFYYKNGIMNGYCSGIMVGPNFVLTAGHCAYSYLNQTWYYDSILVAPAYNNGIVQAPLNTTMVDKVYIFKTFYDQNTYDDVALLQLKQPIGQQIGWIGMAFNTDTNYFNNKVFHKLSYPSVTSPFDSTKVYNGDTMYYNYGNINILPVNNLGINSPQALGIPGQSGSSLFYTDNSEYYSFAVMSFSNHYNHYQIKPSIFYQLKKILSNYSTSEQEVLSSKITLTIYPNPFTYSTTLNTNILLQNATLNVYNSYGQQVKQINNINTQTLQLNFQNLPPSIYNLQLTQDNKVIATKKIIINK